MLEIAALVVAFTALVIARRNSQKLTALTQSYWELRYDFTRLRSTVSRLDPEQADGAPKPPPAAQDVTFVPLSSMKKKNE